MSPQAKRFLGTFYFILFCYRSRLLIVLHAAEEPSPFLQVGEAGQRREFSFHPVPYSIRGEKIHEKLPEPLAQTILHLEGGVCPSPSLPPGFMLELCRNRLRGLRPLPGYQFTDL